jgi:hypothetical protein
MKMPLLYRFLSVFIASSSLIVAAGCRPDEQIETYVVPKDVTIRPVASEHTGEPADRMLVAILPEADKAWFFKIVGPIAEVDARGDEIDTFFASIRPASGKRVPNWELPDGWTEQPASGMRAATVIVPTSGKPLELTVTSLPWTGAAAELLSNVNRWRGQMQLAPIGGDGLAECTRTITAGDAKMTVVDLRGTMGATGMMPPFAGGGASLPAPAAQPSSDAGQLPPGHPPISSDAPQGAGPSPLKFDTPAGWLPLPASGMRKAAFGIVDGDERALVTVIDFPIDAGPMMADPLENVNRWRREVGLGPIARDALDDQTESIEIGGAEGRYMEAVPDGAESAESQADRATLAAMVQHGKLMWFIKLTGNRDLVAGERDRFKTFLKSLQFSPAGGTKNGN